MEIALLALRWLAARIADRFGPDGQRADAGALSLEWIVIAVMLVAAAGLAYTFFKGAIVAEARKLP